MKKILSLLLALCLLAGLSGCFFVENNQSAQAAPTAESVPDGTTLPLFWPPIPEETTEPIPEKTQPIEQTQPNEQDDPVTTKPTTPVVTEPVQTEPVETEPAQTEPAATEPSGYLDPNGTYDSKEDVALFIVLYGRLPNNYVTKAQGSNNWSSTGKCIGGDRFYNREGLLPSGYTYYECDIGTLGKSSRGAKRLVFTYSGIVYYTNDHYASFTLLYGDP